MLFENMLATVIYVVFATAALASHIPHMRRGPTPKGIVDPGAHPGCTIWHDNLDGSIECPMMTYFYNITPEQLLSWVRESHLTACSALIVPAEPNTYRRVRELSNWP